MNSYIEAQHTLQNSLRGVHESLAMQAINEIGVDLSSWAEVPDRTEEVVTAIRALKDGCETDSEGDWWQLNDVLYDDYGLRGTNYVVPVLGAATISLLESCTPCGLYGTHNKGVVEGTKDELKWVSYPVKFVDILLNQPTGKKERAAILLAPDMPAVAVHADDIKYVSNNNPYLHQEVGPAIIGKVEDAFGEDAVETLTPEACVALGDAIRTAGAELESYRNHYWRYRQS